MKRSLLAFISFFWCCLIHAQQITISGRVTDATGKGITNVSVSEQNTGNGTVTDSAGRYILNITNKELMITFSSIGYKTRNIKAAAITPEVILETEPGSLDEIVVVGYGTQTKANLTGAVDKIDAARLEKVKANNLGEALMGQVANLNINISDGKPGRGAGFNIRGTTSINGGGPLVLLDGVPIASFDLNNISPQDIDNISVLKDASSAAIYGARAAYGVILIQTKKGSSQKVEINYNNYFGWKKATRVPKVYKGTDYTEIQEKEFNGNIGQTYFTSDQVQYPYRVLENPELPLVDVKNIGGKQTLLLGGPVHNYYEEWFRKLSPEQNHHISLSGGSEKFKFFLSGDYNHQEGNLIFKPEKIDRYNVRSNTTYNVNNFISVFSRTSFTLRRDDIPNTYLYGFSSNPWRFIDNTNPLLPETITIDGKVIPTDIGFYRQFIEKQSEYKTNTSSFINTIGTDISIKKNLKLHADFSYMYYHWYRFRWWDNTGPYLSHSFNNRNIVLSHYSDAGPAKVYKSNTEAQTFNTNAYITYEKKVQQHNIKLMGGYNFENYNNHYETVEHQNPILGIKEHSLNLATGLFKGSDDDNKYANQSTFFRANYDYLGRYLLELNGMYNLTSRFREDKRGAFFGSVSAGWRISEERFFKSLQPIINNLKIRGSYGSLGNQNIGAFDYLSILNMAQSSYTLDGEQYTYTSFPNPVSQNFTWETSKTIDIGIDLNVFRNRLSATFDYYHRNTENMLAKFHSLPSVYGAPVPKENIASLRNSGWEFSLGWQDRTTNKNEFSYGVLFNISDYKAKITGYYNPTGYLGDYYVGQQIGEIWGLKTLGLFQSDEEAKKSPILQTNGYKQFVGAGNIKFEDSNGDGIISRGAWTLEDHGDYRIIGNSTPRYQYGLTLNAGYRGFDLNAFFRGVGKRDIYPSSETAYFWSSYNRKYQVLFEHAVKDRWTAENPNAYFPKPQGYIALGNNDLGVPQTRYLQDASYLRLKNLVLGYSVSGTWLKKIKRLRIYISGQNLFEKTKLHPTLDPEGLDKDPDANQGSVGMGTAYPIQRTYACGIELSF